MTTTASYWADAPSSIVGAMACPRPVTCLAQPGETCLPGSLSCPNTTWNQCGLFSPSRGACPNTITKHQHKPCNSKNKMEQYARYLLHKTEIQSTPNRVNKL